MSRERNDGSRAQGEASSISSGRAETEPLIGLSRSAWKPVTQNYGLNWLCPARAFPFRQGPVRLHVDWPCASCPGNALRSRHFSVAFTMITRWKPSRRESIIRNRWTPFLRSTGTLTRCARGPAAPVVVGEPQASPADRSRRSNQRERNYRGLGDELIDRVSSIESEGRICRRPRLGGLLNFYDRAA